MQLVISGLCCPACETNSFTTVVKLASDPVSISVSVGLPDPDPSHRRRRSKDDPPFSKSSVSLLRS